MKASKRQGELRVPAPVKGVQVNHCMTPSCTNFGVAPLLNVPLGRPTPNSSKKIDQYRVVGSDGKQALYCKVCGSTARVKSNLGVYEELQRQLPAQQFAELAACQTANCQHQGLPATSNAEKYHRYGRTATGAMRYRCKACLATFSVRVTPMMRRHRKPEVTATIFRLLINKSPIRRICEVADVNAVVLYHRIAFIHQQCQQFVRAQEARLFGGISLPRLRIAVDTQEHVLNWASSDRRNTALSAVASAECTTGYILGMRLNHVPDLDVFDLDLDARSRGDYTLHPPFRRYAALRLPGEDDDPDDPLPPGSRLASKGVMVRIQYMLLAHMHFLARMVPGASDIHLYLDLDSGLRRACLTAFADRIRAGTAEAFMVRIAKGMKVDDRKLALAATDLKLRQAARREGLPRHEAAVKAMASQYASVRRNVAALGDRWVDHLIPHMGEPQKAVCYLTDRGAEDPEFVARAMLEASLHPLDRFFMQVRRRLSLLERPIHSASVNRTWHGYASYDPEVTAQVLAIFRVAYNYCFAGEDGRTPAMRFGLTNQVTTLEEILAFVPTP